jgi:hypothetical protein
MGAPIQWSHAAPDTAAAYREAPAETIVLGSAPSSTGLEARLAAISRPIRSRPAIVSPRFEVVVVAKWRARVQSARVTLSR